MLPHAMLMPADAIPDPTTDRPTRRRTFRPATATGSPGNPPAPWADPFRTSRVRAGLARLWVVFALGASVVPVSAQTVRGRVLDELTSSPVVGAHVILIDSQAKSSSSTLTTDQGVFVLQVPGAGRYHVRVEMIGRRTVDSSPFTIAGSDLTGLAIGLPPDPVMISGIDVRAAQKCEVRPSSGLPTQRVWEEARKALSVEVAVREQRLYRFDITRFTRELDATGRRVVSENARFVTRFSGDPFVSRSAEALAETGYVEADGDGWILYGPNGNVLLSDPFLDTHCLFLRRDGGRRGQIGLAFEPIKDRRLADIEGVLWLDEQTAELRSLEFRYRNLPSGVQPGGHGGEGEFQRLPNGAFIIRDWSIRSPVIQRTEGYFAGQRVGGDRIGGYHVEGGEVINIVDRSGRTVDSAPRAVLAGVVYDSTTNAPLDSAVVTLIGTNYAGRTDAQGRFRIFNLPPGLYEVAFSHDRTNAWRWSPPAVEVELARGEVTEVELAIPLAGPPLVVLVDVSARDSIATLGMAFGHPEWAYLVDSRDAARDTDIDTAGRPGRMRGKVVDELTNRPIVNARLDIDDGTWVLQSDASGNFLFTGIRPGIHQLVITAPGYLRSETRFPLRPSQYLDTEARLTPAVRDTSGRSRPGDRPVARTVHEPITEQPVAVSTTVATKPETFAAVPANTNTSVLHGRVIDIEDGAATRDCTAVRSPIRTSGRAR